MYRFRFLAMLLDPKTAETGEGGGGGGGAPAAPPAPAPEKKGPAPVSMTSDQLTERLREASDKASKKAISSLLADLGFEKPEDLKASVALLKKLESEKLSEVERYQKQIKELEPVAKNAQKLAADYASLVEANLKRLPEKVRETIEEIAGDNASERARLMNVFEQKGFFGQGAGSADAAKGASEGAPPAEAPKPGPANHGATPPAPAGGKPATPFEQYVTLQGQNQALADMFYANNTFAIEASRPATTTK